MGITINGSGTITSSSGSISFDDENLATTGSLTGSVAATQLTGQVPIANLNNSPDLSSDIRALALQAASDRISFENGIADPFGDQTDISVYVQTDGTTIGNLHATNHGGIEAVFNGTTDAPASSSGSRTNSFTDFYVGKQFASAEVVTGFSVTGSNNVGFYSPNDTATITATLYGKNGTPSSGTDGTVIGSAQSATDANSLTLSESNNGNTTAYTHVWVYVSHNDSANSMYCTDLRFTLAGKSVNQTYNSTDTSYTGEGQTAVSQGAGTATGNMTSGGGLSAAFDGSVNAYNAGAKRSATSGTIGKDWGSGVTKKITGVVFRIISNGKIDGGSGAETLAITVERSDNGSDYTQIYSESGISNNANGQTFSKLTGFTNTTAARYVRINFSHGGGGECHVDEVTFYESTDENMTLVSNAFTATSAPSSTVIGLQTVESAYCTPNTDFTAEVSRDGGTTFTACTLALKSTLGASGTKYYESASTDISSQPSGTSMKYRIKTLNNKKIQVHGVALKWS